MRIAYLNPSGQLGGAEACLLDMVAVVRSSRPEWLVSAILGESGPLQRELEALGTKVEVLPFPAPVARLGDSGESSLIRLIWKLLRSTPQTFIYRRQLRSALAQIEPDLIHTNGFKMHVLGALTKPKRSKLTWHIHDYLSCRPLMARIMRELSSRVDAIITNSHSVAEDVGQRLSSKNIVAILNAVDLDEFRPDGSKLGFPHAATGSVRVGLVATMAWWKGHRLFLNAISQLDPALKVHAFVIGGSVYQTQSKQESIESLRSYAAELCIAERVTFTGFVSDPAAAIRAMDIVVHTSTEREPFGRVIVEAMACGKPVIGSALGGAAEILKLGNFARTFTPNNAASLAAMIAELASNPALRAHLGANGLSIARARFGRTRLASELLPVYEAVCAVPMNLPDSKLEEVLK